MVPSQVKFVEDARQAQMAIGLKACLLLHALVGQALGYNLASPVIRQLARSARRSLDDSLYFAIAPSPFALSQSFETSAFLPSAAKETTVTMLWPQEQQVRRGHSNWGPLALAPAPV